MRRAPDVAALTGFAQIGHETPTRHGTEHFERRRVNYIAQRKPPLSTPPLRNRLNVSAEIRKQDLEVILLRRLREIVGWPLLPVGGPFRNSESLGYGCRSISVVLTLNNEPDGQDVFAKIPAKFEVGGSRTRHIRQQCAHRISSSDGSGLERSIFRWILRCGNALRFRLL